MVTYIRHFLPPDLFRNHVFVSFSLSVLFWLPHLLLTPHSTVLLEKLTGSAASQEIPRNFWTRRFLAVLTSARHLSLSWANSIQSPKPPPTSSPVIYFYTCISFHVTFIFHFSYFSSLFHFCILLPCFILLSLFKFILLHHSSFERNWEQY